MNTEKYCRTVINFMVYIYVLTNFLFGCDFLIAYSTKKTIFNFYDNKWKKKPRKKNSEETFTETISTITESHDITMLNINSVCPTSWYVNSSSCRSFLCISSLVLIPVDSRCEKKNSKNFLYTKSVLCRYKFLMKM